MTIEPTARSLLTLLFRRKWAFIVTAFFVVAAGVAYLMLATPQYKSDASLIIRFDDKVVSTTNLARDTTPEVSAQQDRREIVVANAEILKSPDLAAQVIQEIGLEKLYPDIAADPPTRGTPMDQALLIFSKKLEVEPGQQGVVIQLGFMHPDPRLAQEVLQRLVSDYMNREGEVFSGTDTAFQEQQVRQAQTQLQADQAALQAFKAQTGITSFDDQITALIKQRSDLAGSLQSAQVSLGQATERRNELETLLGTVTPNVQNSAAEKYHAADDAESRLADLRVKERQMLATYSPNSPMLDQLRASIATAQADVQRNRNAVASRDASAPNTVYQNIQTDLLRAKAEAKAFANSVTVLTKQVASLDAELHASEANRMKLRDLTRAVEIDDSAYRAFVAHLEDARVVENRVRDRISHGALISQPTLAYKPARPRYLVTALATVLAAMMVGLGMVIGLELIDDRFTEARQVEQQLGIPVLASFGDGA